jgi:peptide/nickel transport system substrate-binding protein
MAWREGPDLWREGPEDTNDTENMSEWERAAYHYAAEAALSRGRLLKLAGLGLGGVLLGPVAEAGARLGAPTRLDAQSSTLIWGRAFPPINLDPHGVLSVTDNEIVVQIFDTLVYTDKRGKIYPGLATAWSFSRDGRAIKFKLRRGVTFHDGSPLDAAAVKASFDRWRDPKSGSNTRAGLIGPLTGVQAVDQYTLNLLFDQGPFPPILVNLSQPGASIVSKVGADRYGAQFRRNPVGTGPYRFSEWRADDTVVLKRNPAHTWATPYYVAPTGKPLGRAAQIDTVEARVIPAEATRIAALVGKEVDMLQGSTSVPNTQIASLKRRSDVKVQLTPSRIRMLVLNAGKEPLTDVRVRQAMSHAIDRKRLVALALAGQGKPGTNVLGSIYAAYDPSVAKYCEYDLTKARSLMRAAGKSSGFEIESLQLSGFATESESRTLQVLQQDFSKINIKFTVKTVALADYLKLVGVTTPIGERTETYLNGYNPGFSADSGSVLNAFWHSGTGLFAHFTSDKELDALLERQGRTVNPAKRRALVVQAQQRIAAKAYALPLFEENIGCAAQDYVRNVRLDWKTFVHLQELMLVR